MLLNNTIDKTKMGYLLCAGVSALVLTSCMPDDENADKRADGEHSQAQVAHYSQAFQQYSSRSINAVVESDLWKTQTLPEGLLTLTTSALGSQDLGGSEAYVDSAYCVIAGTPRHLTWFEGENEEGDLFLKGLGKDRAGQTATKLRQMIAKENFGIARGVTIEMADGSIVTPSGGCATLNIPQGSAVAVVPLPEPVEVAETQEKYIMRALNCAAGTEGNILQRVMATYMPSGNIVVGASSFTTEAGVMSDNGLAWEVLANNCIAPTQEIERTVSDTVVDALDVANLITIPGEIAETLEVNLTDKDCKDVKKGSEDEDTQADGEADADKKYDTCAGPEEIKTLEGVEISPDTLVKTEEEIIHASCGGQAAGSSTVTIAPGSANFQGIHSGLSGKAGTLSYTNWSGDVAYKKITRFYEIVQDFGDGTGGRGATADGNCGNGGCSEVVVYEGLDLQCDRNETLSIACSTMYAPGGTLITNNGMSYSRPRAIRGWQDTVNLVPNQPNDASWSAGSMNCVWRETKTENPGCPSGYSGTKTIDYERKFSATTPTNGGWSGWTTTATHDNCSIIYSSSDSGSDSVYYIDTDNDGIADSISQQGSCAWDCSSNLGQQTFRDQLTRATGSNPFNTSDGRYKTTTSKNGVTGQSGGNSGSSSGGSSGGSSSSSVLCTYYYRKGWLDRRTYVGDVTYGARHVKQQTLNGYHLWAIPLVRFLQKHEGGLLEKIVFHTLVDGWSKEMAYRTGFIKKGDVRGRIILKTIAPLCTLIGAFIEKQDYQSLWRMQ